MDVEQWARRSCVANRAHAAALRPDGHRSDAHRSRLELAATVRRLGCGRPAPTTLRPTRTPRYSIVRCTTNSSACRSGIANLSAPHALVVIAGCRKRIFAPFVPPGSMRTSLSRMRSRWGTRATSNGLREHYPCRHTITGVVVMAELRHHANTLPSYE